MGFHSRNDNDFDDFSEVTNNRGILDKIKHFPSNFMQYSRKKKIIVSASAVGVIALLGIGSYMLSATHKIHVAENQQKALVQKLSVQDKTPKNGKYTYNQASGVPDLDKLFKLRQQAQGITLRGQISIPKYRVNVPVFEGTNDYTLAWGAGTAKPNQQFGKGNYAVQAHNFNELGKAKDWYFSNFENGLAPYNTINLKYIKIPLNTMVYARDSKNVYEYKIVHRQITDSRYPNSGSVLTDRMTKAYKNKPIITMSTCYEQTGITYPPQRIILVGKLVKTEKSKDFKDMKEVFSGSLE